MRCALGIRNCKGKGSMNDRSCDTVLGKALADFTASSGAGMVPGQGQGIRAHIP